jgi:hypothetical protein
MASKGWLIGCGSIVVLVGLAVILATAYFATRATDFTRAIEDARDRYAGLNRDFPFQVPAPGALSEDRFKSYLKVRAVLHDALAPLQNSRGVVEGFSQLARVPDEVSRAHAEALRQQSMSIDEYRWISRQVYTTVVAESSRPDPDPAIRDLQSSMQRGPGRRGGIRIGRDSDSDDALDPGLLDLSLLRIPDATRQMVQQHAAELARSSNASMADSLLADIDFERTRR